MIINDQVQPFRYNFDSLDEIIMISSSKNFFCLNVLQGDLIYVIDNEYGQFNY
jgi:hypothetical protein